MRTSNQKSAQASSGADARGERAARAPEQPARAVSTHREDQVRALNSGQHRRLRFVRRSRWSSAATSRLYCFTTRIIPLMAAPSPKKSPRYMIQCVLSLRSRK